MTYFATRSSLVLHYAYRCRDLLHRINGPVSTMALHEMRGLYMELGLKIGELERMGHWSTAELATTDTAQTGKDQPTPGSAPSCPIPKEAIALRKLGTKIRRLDAARK